MLKSEVIRNLKKNNVSKNAEKTKVRVREMWAPLKRDVREEILSLADIKKVSIERAYKTGGVSARVIVAMSQVLDVDPRWFAGEVDEQGVFDVDAVRKYLNGLGYDIGKQDIAKKADSSAPETLKKPGAKPKTETPDSDFIPDASSDMYNITRELAKLLSKDIRTKLDELSEEDVTLLIKSLTVQADFNEEKHSRLALVKCLLLV
ncbi:MAG: hypothetical protein FWC70_00065 [Defluviitaleaceae bacterium]|nr:hypothetical protein [Defluviitaleaceae bacterium]